MTVLAFLHRVQVWELYLMNTLVAAGFWMFWPTITALIQELTPEGEFVQSNTFLLAGIQGGWLIAGAIVGFVYEHIGLGGVLLIDVSTYVVSFSCYFAVRQGRHVVPRAVELRHDLEAAETAVGRFLREMREGLVFLREHPQRRLFGDELGSVPGRDDDRSRGHGAAQRSRLSCRRHGLWMAERRMGRGRVHERALCSRADCSRGIARVRLRLSMLLLTLTMAFSPFSPWLALAVLLYGLMGSARGVSGVAMNTSLMEQVPPHVHGTRPEHFLFLWHVLCRSRWGWGGLDCIADQPGGRIWHDRCGLCGRVWQRLLAHSRAEGCRCGRGLGLCRADTLSAAVDLVSKLMRNVRSRSTPRSKAADKSVRPTLGCCYSFSSKGDIHV